MIRNVWIWDLVLIAIYKVKSQLYMRCRFSGIVIKQVQSSVYSIYFWCMNEYFLIILFQEKGRFHVSYSPALLKLTSWHDWSETCWDCFQSAALIAKFATLLLSLITICSEQIVSLWSSRNLLFNTRPIMLFRVELD